LLKQKQSSIGDDKVVFESLGPGTESDAHPESIASPISKEEGTENSVTEGNSDDPMLQNNDELVLEVTNTTEIQTNEQGAIIKEECVQDKPVVC
jgi:hypothetical protein